MADDDSQTPGVSRYRGRQQNTEMTTFGLLVAAGVAVVLFPLWPVALVYWLWQRLTGEREDGGYASA